MYCGIDVAKGKSEVCILDKDKKVIAQFEMTHDKEGFEKLESNLTKDTEIAMEYTGYYSKPIYAFLKPNYKVYFVDNYQMYNFARVHSLNIKNDKVDSRLIALALSSGLKKITPKTEDEMKDLSRLYNKLLRTSIKYKCMFKAQLAAIFPEFEKNFLLRRPKAVGYMLLAFPTPQDIQNASEEELLDELKCHGRGTSKIDLNLVRKLKKTAQDTIGVPDYPTVGFRYTIKLMLLYEELKEGVLDKIAECLKKSPYNSVLNEWGYKTTTLGAIVGEVGDIRRFPTHKHFVAYCGFDVTETTSGSSVHKNTYITKRGNNILRFVFYTMAVIHLSHKTELSKFFYRLRDEKGKHAKVAMVATARKIAIQTYYFMKKCHEVKEGESNNL